MSEWIRTRWRLSNRICLIEIRRDHPHFQVALDASQVFSQAPAHLEAGLRVIVCEAHPWLTECCIETMGFNWLRNCIEVGISHPKLAPVLDGCEVPRVLLEELKPEGAEVACG